SVEIRNRADQLTYSVEKAMADLGGKVDGQKRSEIEDRIRALRTKLEQNASAEELKRGMDELSKSAQDVVSKAYEQSQGAQGAQRPGGAAKGGDEPDDGGEYIDAEYDKK
ncbi:MAG: Hsp70 family protein, partial [Candidatus Bipolaricaulota bacterium]|nr:Hsp70 family protein [Candidatus Bipolaricaulota bacterium]